MVAWILASVSRSAEAVAEEESGFQNDGIVAVCEQRTDLHREPEAGRKEGRVIQ